MTAPKWPARTGKRLLASRRGLVPGLIGVVLVGREDPVERLAGVSEYLPRLCLLGVGAGADDLEGRHAELAHQGPHLDCRAARAAGHDIPGSAQLVRVRRHVVLAVIGEHVAAAAAVSGLGPDQALVLQLLQGRVDGARTRPPDSPAALADLLDDLVTVHRLLGQQGQRRRPDVTTLGPRSAHPRLAGPGAEAVETRRARHPAGEAAAHMAAATAAPRPPTLVLAAVPLFVSIAPSMPVWHLRILAVVPPEFFVSHNKFS